MIKKLVNNSVIMIGLLLSVLTPICIIGYEIIFSGKDSVTLTFDTPIGYIIAIYYSLLLILSIYLLLSWLINQIQIVKKLKIEKTHAELSHLKAQVNPHFFFNMLNNLYGWIDKDSTVAKELILKLSDMMRYSIYEGQKDNVLLVEEVDFLKNFIELNTIRYHKKVDVSFTIEIDNQDIQVMPLMYIILVENAFKHGVEKLSGDAFVHIILKASENVIDFNIQNTFDSNDKSSTGIGLQNLDSRLKSMYPNSYTLVATKTHNTYTAQLTITI